MVLYLKDFKGATYHTLAIVIDSYTKSREPIGYKFKTQLNIPSAITSF